MARQWKLRGYVIERLLGAGGTGEVWRARVAATGDAVALKRLVSGEARHARRVEAEAALLAALEHPNLIRLHGVERDGPSHVLVLDLAEGGSLADLLAVRGRLTPGEVVTAIAPVAAALAYAHGQGIVHGDVSAANILFTAAGVPLLADLGTARLVGDDVEAESTPGYVDPAVAVGCVPGPSSDVFMLGGVALHALTGEPPWRGATAAEALAAARTGDLGDVAGRLAAADVPAEMAGIVARALSSDSLDRGAASAFALDLRYSVEPVAVELHAGLTSRDIVARGAREAAAGRRDRPRGGRHAADDAIPAGAIPAGAIPADAIPAGPLPWQPMPAAGPAGPGELGSTHADLPGRPPPTTTVRPRPRPRLPGRRRLLVPSRRLVTGLTLVALVVAAGALAANWSTAAPSTGAPAARASHRSAVPANPSPDPSPVLTPPTAATRAPATPRPVRASMRGRASEGVRADGQARPSGASGSGSWLAALDELDARRAAAFAQRRPAMLSDVYAATSLRRSDARLLRRLVPPGCGLHGVRTAFDAVRVSSAAGRARILATASLPTSRLVCHGRVTARAAGTAPTRLLVTLVRTRAGPRVQQERREPAAVSRVRRAGRLPGRGA